MNTTEPAVIRTFEDLECWKQCRTLRLFVAKEVVPVLPKDERYRLGDQLLRAARSTTSNIAEGYGSITSTTRSFAAMRGARAGKLSII
jgi:four helix bundle protein